MLQCHLNVYAQCPHAINSRWKNKGKKLKIAHGRPRLMGFQHWNITMWWPCPVGIQVMQALNWEETQILICLVKSNSRLGIIFSMKKCRLEQLDMVPIPHIVKLVGHLLIPKLADEKGRTRSCLHWTIWPGLMLSHLLINLCLSGDHIQEKKRFLMTMTYLEH